MKMKKTILINLFALLILISCSKPKEKAIPEEINQGLVEAELTAWLDTLKNSKNELKSALVEGFHPEYLTIPGDIKNKKYIPKSDENPLEYDVIPIPVIYTTADKKKSWKSGEKVEKIFSLNKNEVSLFVVKNKQIIFQTHLKKKYNIWEDYAWDNFQLNFSKIISKEVFINKRQFFVLQDFYDERYSPQFLQIFKEKDQFFMINRVGNKYVLFSDYIKEPHNCLN